MNRRYYEEEMRYLREAGRAFAEAHPEEAGLLNIDSVADRDPYVERLFEGFAFLTGRIHERLDDELPVYTEGLLELLYPHFLRPVPALTVLALDPLPGLVQETTVLARGLDVRSTPVGDERAVCRFTTTQDVRLQPIHLREAALHWTPDAASHVRLRFELERGVDYRSLDLSPLRLYVHAAAPVASTLHLFLTRHVRRVVLRAGDGSHEAVLPGPDWIRPARLEREAGLLPYGPQSFSGFRLLQEYLCFRRSFWFVDLLGLERLQPAAGTDTFEVEVFFDRPYPEDRHFTADHLRLHCTPAVNLFRMDAEPIRAEGFASSYRVQPSARFRRSLETYDVEEVVAVDDRTARRHAYTPFFSFRHEGYGARRSGTDARRTFSTTRRPGPTGTPEVHLATGCTTPDELHGASETLSLSIRATNGSLPHEHLPEGTLTELAPDVPRLVRPTNLTRPTRPCEPPAHGDFYWDLISHLSLNFRSVASREALGSLLALYDWTGTEANRRRRAGLRDVRWAPKEILQRGGVLRGTEVTVDVEAGHFADEGDLCLFGEVLRAFLARYVTLNAFVHLVLVLHPTGTRYEWPPLPGDQPLL